MSRHGKIARLPLTVREALNQRLLNNKPAEPILTWLNPLPEVQAILKDQFAGVPISKQNLHEWRSGGYREWELKRDLKYDAAETKADGAELDTVTDGCLADHLATVLTARYASLIRSWHGETTDEFRATLKVLHALIQDVSQLRRWDHNAIKITLATERLEDQREKVHQQEMAELTKKVQRQQDFIQILESMVNDSPATPPPPKPAGQTQSKPASHDSHTSHSSHSSPPPTPAVSPEPQPILDPTSRSNPVKVSQSAFTNPPAGHISSEITSNKTITSNLSSPSSFPSLPRPPNPGDIEALPAAPESNSVKEGQSNLTEASEPASPCMGICQRDGGGYCTGCLRSTPEIIRWPQMPPEQKSQCLEHLAARRRRKERGE